MTSDGYAGDGSPDRADALVWALSELMVQAFESPQPCFGSYGRGQVTILDRLMGGWR
jgi:hypothetical protein